MTYLIEHLAEHARTHPEREVLVKLRSLPGERVTHVETFGYQELLRELGSARPANLRTSVADMGEVLERTDPLITVSSTAAVEAIHCGVPTAVLTDFGMADASWARRNGLGASVDQLPARVAELLTAGELAPIVPFYTAVNAGALLPGLLASYGVGVDGAALTHADGLPDVLRTAMRSGARSVYRHGRTVVAPALGKLAAL